MITTTAIVNVCGLRDAKTCSKCKETMHKSMFGKNKQTKDGLYYYCKECVSKICKERRSYVKGVKRR